MELLQARCQGADVGDAAGAAMILPEANQHDLDEIPPELARKMSFHFVRNMTEVLELAWSSGSCRSRLCASGVRAVARS